MRLIAFDIVFRGLCERRTSKEFGREGCTTCVHVK